MFTTTRIDHTAVSGSWPRRQRRPRSPLPGHHHARSGDARRDRLAGLLHEYELASVTHRIVARYRVWAGRSGRLGGSPVSLPVVHSDCASSCDCELGGGSGRPKRSALGVLIRHPSAKLTSGPEGSSG